MPRKQKKECSEIQIRNPATGRCVKKTGKIGKMLMRGQAEAVAVEEERREVQPSTPTTGRPRPEKKKKEIEPKQKKRIIEMATAILAEPEPSTPTTGRPRPQRKKKVQPSTPTSGRPRPQRKKQEIQPSTPISGKPRPRRVKQEIEPKVVKSEFKGFIVPRAVKPLKPPTAFVVPPIDVLKDMRPNIPSFVLDPKLVSELKKPKASKKASKKPLPTVPYNVQQEVMRAVALPQMNIPTEQRVFTSAIPMVRPNLYPRAELQQKVPKLDASWGLKYMTQIPKVMQKFKMV